MTNKESIQNHINSLDIIPAGAISAVVVDQQSVGIIIDVAKLDDKADHDKIRETIENSVKSLDGIDSVSVIMTKERNQPQGGVKPAPDFSKPKAKAAPSPDNGGLNGVKHIIAVASGKGGVGKSTTAVNVALALKELGHSVGLLDADIFGPSLPKLLNTKIDGRPPIIDGVIQPIMVEGMKTMSIGYMVNEDQPVIWRGPKVMGAVNQLFKDVDWTGTDILVLDLPPGTGDVQLSISQTVKLSGALIVSTPQDLALLDARKGLKMFEMVNIPILGILENMSHFVCPKCGEESHVFGAGGTQKAAEELNTNILGHIPLHLSLRGDTTSGETAAAFMMKDASTSNADEKAIREAYLNVATKIEEAL